MPSRWTLPDLASLEELLIAPKVTSDHQAHVKESLQKGTKQSEGDQRKQGIQSWFKLAHQESQSDTSQKLSLSLALIRWIIILASAVAGVGLISSLIERVGVTEGQAYNVWKLLVIPIAGQWFFLLLTLLSWTLLRKGKRKTTLVEELTGAAVKALSGTAGARGWNALYRAGASYRSILSWRLARLTQWGAVAFNLGLIVGFLGILLFLEINFFWATTLDNFGLPQLLLVTETLATPWHWLNASWTPTKEQLLVTQLQIGELNAKGNPAYWYPFILGCLICWGLLPRIVLLCFCYLMERKALDKLTFMEKRHRDLWRKLTPRVRETPSYDTAQDGIILIDVGGAAPSTEEIRPFLLQQLRVNPVERYRAGVIEGNEREQALKSLQKAQRGVILLTESWDLSPKQLQSLHHGLRDIIKDRVIYYLVLGLPKGGVTQAPTEAELTEWHHYIAELQDSETELIPYNPQLVLSKPSL